VPIVERERGADPASVVFDTLAQARQLGSDLVLVDTAGRLHTSADLMQELAKVQRVARAQSVFPVRSLLVIDATTGQNGLVQARAFNETLDLDGVVLTKLDGTARGGIAVAVSSELGLPIVRVGVGESLADLRPFEPAEFARALLLGR
jgi:fused signal recognition particle receptor